MNTVRTIRSTLRHATSISHRLAGHDYLRAMFKDIGPAPKTCRYPTWRDDERPTHRYCGRKVRAAGEPYCKRHAEVCWRPQPQGSVAPMPWFPGRR